MGGKGAPVLVALAGPAGPARGPGPGAGGSTGSGEGWGLGVGSPVALVPGGGTGGSEGGGLPGLPLLGAPAVAMLLGPGPGGGAAPAERGVPDAVLGPGGLYVGIAGSFDMPTGVTASDYDADALCMPNLLAEVRKRTQVHVTVQERVVPLKFADIKDIPVLHVRGHRCFSFTPEEREAIRQYVAHGGTILAEDSHGPFGECFRREMHLIFGRPLRDLPPDHEIYRAHYVLKTIPAGDMGERYPLQGLDVGGRLGIIFSRNDYGGCWDGTGGWVHPDSREPAFQMGTNMFVYIVAHWNKGKQAP